MKSKPPRVTGITDRYRLVEHTKDKTHPRCVDCEERMPRASAVPTGPENSGLMHPDCRDEVVEQLEYGPMSIQGRRFQRPEDLLVFDPPALAAYADAELQSDFVDRVRDPKK